MGVAGSKRKRGKGGGTALEEERKFPYPRDRNTIGSSDTINYMETVCIKEPAPLRPPTSTFTYLTVTSSLSPFYPSKPARLLDNFNS